MVHEWPGAALGLLSGALVLGSVQGYFGHMWELNTGWVMVPLVRDFCIRGLAVVQLGALHNDRFFCSQFVLEAYRYAQLPLTSADPRLVNPADLLHMREGDVPSVRTEQALQYVGHLKTTVLPMAEDSVSLSD